MTKLKQQSWHRGEGAEWSKTAQRKMVSYLFEFLFQLLLEKDACVSTSFGFEAPLNLHQDRRSETESLRNYETPMDVTFWR